MKSLKKLLVPFIVMIALILAVVIWAVFFNKNDDTDSSDQTEDITLLTIGPSELASISVDKREGEDIAFSSYTGADGTVMWKLAGENADDTVELNQSGISSYIYLLSSYAANSMLTEPGELSEYGLDDPSFIITLVTNAGETHTIKIGDQTYDNINCYMMIDDDPNVYTVAVIKRIYSDYALIDFLSTQLLNIDYSKINTVEFIRNTDGIDITANCDINSETGEPMYTIIDPFKIKGSPYFENLIEYIATLEITSFVELTEADLPEYGLDDPAFTFIFTMDTGETTTISLSREMAGSYYGTCTGVEGYFVISTMQISGLETPILTLIDSYLTYYPASEISSITGTYGDETFELTLDVDNAISDDNATVNLNMRNLMIKNTSGRSYAATLFESLVCIDIGGIDMEATPSYDPVMSFNYVTKHYQTILVEFVQRDTDSYYVFMDGTYTGFYVYSRELFNDGGQDTFNYGAWAAYELAQEAINNAVNGVYDIPSDEAGN